jgi:hypothetical protein
MNETRMKETRMNETRMNETDEHHRMWDWLLYPLVAFSMAIQQVLSIPTILLGKVLALYRTVRLLFWLGLCYCLFGTIYVYFWNPLELDEDWDTMVEGPAETGGANHE